MTQSAMIAAEIESEGDRHNCCCEHLVDNIEAAPVSESERYLDARTRWYACPHNDITPLEIFLDHLRSRV